MVAGLGRPTAIPPIVGPKGGPLIRPLRRGVIHRKRTQRSHGLLRRTRNAAAHTGINHEGTKYTKVREGLWEWRTESEFHLNSPNRLL